MFTPGLFTTAKIQKLPKCPSVSDWMKELQSINTQWNTKDEILLFVTTQIELEGKKLKKK